MRRLLIIAAAVLSVAAPVALASRAPTKGEANAIAKVFGSPAMCLKIRVSTVDSHYARTNFRNPPSKACLKYAADGIAILKHTTKWKPVFEGSSYTCSDVKVPKKVKKDLKVPGC